MNTEDRNQPRRPIKTKMLADSYTAQFLTLEKFPDCLDIVSRSVRGQLAARCPAHFDSNPSLSVNVLFEEEP